MKNTLRSSICAGIFSAALFAGGQALAQAGPGGGRPGGPPPGGGPGGGQPPSIDQVFDHLDANHDGHIDPQELLRARPARPQGPPGGGPNSGGRGGGPGGGPGMPPPPPPGGGPGGGQGMPPSPPPGGGAPGGGPGGRQPGGPPGPPLPGFRYFDADGDGLISRAEFSDGLTLWREAHEAFRNADADRDRKLSAAEYLAAGFATPLGALDANGDGSIEPPEFFQWVEQNRKKP
jgi:Ca2+-binding EF-hand superfamily protein